MKYDSKLDKNMLSNDVEYFYSLHGPRFDYMNEQMAKSLSKKYGKEFRPIRIINAWPSKKYDTANYIVMNKRGYELRDELGSPAVYLPDYEDVNVEFSRDIEIRKLSKKLLKKQKKIYVFPFTTSFLELPQDMYQILGPDSLIAKEFDSKINQLKLFDKLDLPRNKTKFYKDVDHLLSDVRNVYPCYLSATYTSGGNESGLMYNEEMVREFVASLRKVNLRNPFTASSIFENIVNAPNVNAVVDSEGNVDTLVLSDQILQGNRYLGNTYPSRVSDKIEDEIDRVTQVIGSYLHKKGYIGMFGLDFLINNMGDLVVIDLNPRHQGGYACNGLLFNAGRASLTDIELDILTGEKLNCNLEKIQSIDYAWAHSKLKPADKGEKIMSELQLNTITSPFLEVGASFVGEFYKKGSVFIEGYIGYQVSTGEDVENTLEALSLSKKTFDNQVLGDI